MEDYQASFDLLRDDLREVLEFIEPTDPNADTFSHRLFALLLRVCTDFESLAKDLVVSKKLTNTKPRDMNIDDYRLLEPSLALEDFSVEVQFWRPRPKTVEPFKNWTSQPLAWYQAYNKAKHNRRAELRQASLLTVTTALAGQFCVVAKASDFHWSGPPELVTGRWDQATRRATHTRYPFRVHYTF